MKRLIVCMASLLVLAAVSGCTSGPAPAPTAAPAAAPKPAEATKAPAVPTTAPAQPTAAPAKKVDFPQNGKAITLIVGWPAGGGVDVGARLLAPMLETQLGVPIQVVNKPGASGQAGDVDLVGSKPDGYTIGSTLVPGTMSVYLDPTRKATYSRKSFEPLALHNADAAILAVMPDSPYKTAKDLIEAAKAKPDTIKMASSGIMSPAHLGILQLQKATGAKFTIVQFEGAAPAKTALLGGHVDVNLNWAADYLPQAKSGEIRALGITDSARSKFYPDLPTMQEQGYNVVWSSARGYSAPAGTPKEIVDILATAMQRAINSDEHKNKMEAAAMPLKYMNAQQYGAWWDEMDTVLKPLILEASQQ